jgi:RNA recognition motif-containing protein
MAARSIYKLFVGNLPWTVGHQELRHYFSEFGHVASAHVVFDKNTGMSRGYGFVLFGNQGGYNNATNKQNHSLEGNQISVQSASN